MLINPNQHRESLRRDLVVMCVVGRVLQYCRALYSITNLSFKYAGHFIVLCVLGSTFFMVLYCSFVCVVG